jgi:hypothetical protein
LTALAGGRCAHQERQVLGHPMCRPGSILGHVEEVAKVGDEHAGDGIAGGRIPGRSRATVKPCPEAITMH